MSQDRTTSGEQHGQSKGAQTRRAILEAAIARFGRDGYRATSVADIARDASVGGTVAYAYFSNKEALFLAAVDEDVAAVISEGVASLIEGPRTPDWLVTMIATVLGAVEHHPLTKRLLAGLEPEAAVRVPEIPALAELRKVVSDRIRVEQIEGTVRSDIDPARIGSGLVSIVLTILLGVSQFDPTTALSYSDDVAAVFAAALDPIQPPPGSD